MDAIARRIFTRDIFGHRTEVFEDHPSAGWVGADVWFGRVAGYDRLELAGSTSWLDHTDAVGTITMQTDPTGADTWDATHYPWGQVWQQTGSHPTGGFYADLEFAINDPVIPSATREYNPWYYRWLTPDPGGRKVVKLNNPQTWNMYAYVGDNPTSDNDPSGMVKACKESSKACDNAPTPIRALKATIVTVTANVTTLSFGLTGFLANQYGQQVLEERSGLLRWEGQHPNITALIGIGAMLGGGGGEDVTPEGEPNVRAGAAEGENPAQFKRLSNGEIDKLKENGIDPEELKPNARYDLFKDKRGNIYVMPKSGGGPGDPTGFNINNY